MMIKVMNRHNVRMRMLKWTYGAGGFGDSYLFKKGVSKLMPINLRFKHYFDFGAIKLMYKESLSD
jgi:hypothetical protein